MPDFNCHVKKVTVAEKKVKQDDYIEVHKVGTLTLEFNADSVNVHQLAALIGDAPVAIGLESTQLSMAGFQ